MLSQKGGFITAFVPTNKAVMQLARKPHQGPAPVDEGIKITEAQFDKESKDNVRQWVSAHLVPGEVGYPSADETVHLETLLPSKSISMRWAFPSESGKKWTGMEVEGSSRIVDMHKGSNGVLYIIDGTIEVPEQ